MEPDAKSSPGPDQAKMSDRICQFFIRGRCKRDNCEFKHEQPPVVAVKSSAAVTEDTISVSVNESIKDASTFIAAGAEGGTSTPLLARRAKTAKDDDDALTNGNSKKVIRRDSKGFENFDDYFSDNDDTAASKTIEDQTVDSPNKDVPIKNLEEEVQAPVRDSVSADQREAAAPKDAVEKESPKKSVEQSVAELSKEWDDDEPAEKEQEGDQGETIENIESFIQEDAADADKGSSSQAATSEPSADKSKSNKEWVTEIFGADGMKERKKSVYDLNPEGDDFSVAESTPFTTKPIVKQDEDEQVVAVKGRSENAAKNQGLTKIGNNTYFYSGPKSMAEQEAEESETLEEHGDDSQMEGEDETENEQSVMEEGSFVEAENDTVSASRSKSKVTTKGYANGRRKHNTNYVYGAKSTAAKSRRCGECEGCNREDCGKCTACVDKPKFGGKGGKKQACIYRMCSWKNPSATKITPGSAPVAIPPVVPPDNSPRRGKKGATPKSSPAPEPRKKGRQSISVISPSSVPKGRKAIPPDDSDLPSFDPEKFKPGYVPPVVKKGNDEYAIIVSGVKDTGLCGKYWSDIDNLPPRRRRTPVEAAKAESKQVEQQSPTPSRRGKQSRKQELTEKVDPSEEGNKTRGNGPANSGGKKRKNEASESEDEPPVKKSGSSVAQSEEEEHGDMTKSISKQEPEESLTKSLAANTLPTAPTASDPMANRSVSCVAADSTQREVVVECFAPYDDHKWVNIGKVRDGMAPDAVQYARALRPPYHLLSFLRIKGHSTKGMSCTDKNTMVFVVLEGEITVVLHTTQFNAKKGDSFYIPPKNYYNLINQKAREAELSLIQFQYDGPLPTVNAASQSGAVKTAVSAPSSQTESSQ